MQAGTRLQRLLVLAAQLAQAAHVVQREAESVDRPLEDQQQAIAAVDQAAAPALLQVQHDAVMGAEQLRRRVVADALHQAGRIDQVGQQQGPHLRRGRDGRVRHG